MSDFDFSKFQLGDLDKLLAQSKQMVDSLGAAQDDLAETAGSGESKNGLVKATVGYDGRVRSVDVSPRAMRLASQELSEAIVAAIDAAHADLETKTTKIITEALGGPPPTAPSRDQIEAQFEAVRDGFSALMDEKENSISKALRAFKDLA